MYKVVRHNYYRQTMHRQISILTFLILTFQIGFGQNLKTPKNIVDAVSFLETDCSDSLKTIIKNTADEKLINICYPWNGDYKTIFHWTERGNKKSKIKKYFIKNGIADNKHQQTVILIAFKKHLSGQAINENEIFEPFRKTEKIWNFEDKVRFTTDSIRGQYIPKDIEDCFKQIDKFWSDSTKIKIKQLTEEKFSSNAHLSFGMWMRNNWQLWGGSRLSKYFNDKGIYHPDDMSGIILDSYHRYLTGKDIQLDKQIEFYQLYYKVNKEPTKDIYPKGVKKLEFNKSQVYNLKNGKTPGCVHIQTNSKTDMTWIYDFHFGWKLIDGQELKELNSTNYDNREDMLKKIFSNVK